MGAFRIPFVGFYYMKCIIEGQILSFRINEYSSLVILVCDINVKSTCRMKMEWFCFRKYQVTMKHFIGNLALRTE